MPPSIKEGGKKDLETWWSGLTHLFAKELIPNGIREFESHRLRQIEYECSLDYIAISRNERTDDLSLLVVFLKVKSTNASGITFGHWFESSLLSH